MKKRILSIALALAMCLSLLPAMALAADGTEPDGTLYANANAAITTPLDFTNVGDQDGQTPAQGAGYNWSGDAQS